MFLPAGPVAGPGDATCQDVEIPRFSFAAGPHRGVFRDSRDPDVGRLLAQSIESLRFAAGENVSKRQ